MILVLTGTHHQPFDRLVTAAAALAAEGERVVVQAGTSTAVAPGCEVRAWVSPDALAALADEADAFVVHAGPGSLFLAWDRGRVPVVVPREAARAEHVDDHQVRFCAVIGDRARVVTDVDTLAAAVAQVRTLRGETAGEGPRRSRAFASALGEVADRVVARGRHRAGLRATLRSVLFRLGTHRP
ncbi:MAG: hypothetical protein H6733_15760 [Alphaproteobacteria bacterium]|nr:hypothetical protein [Alphaproteobacteria bacterium]